MLGKRDEHFVARGAERHGEGHDGQEVPDRGTEVIKTRMTGRFSLPAAVPVCDGPAVDHLRHYQNT